MEKCIDIKTTEKKVVMFKACYRWVRKFLKNLKKVALHIFIEFIENKLDKIFTL